MKTQNRKLKKKKHCEENVICCSKNKNIRKRIIVTIELKSFTNIFHDVKFDT